MRSSIRLWPAQIQREWPSTTTRIACCSSSSLMGLPQLVLDDRLYSTAPPSSPDSLLEWKDHFRTLALQTNSPTSPLDSYEEFKRFTASTQVKPSEEGSCYHAIMHCLVQHGLVDAAFGVLSHMHSRGVPHDIRLFNQLLQASLNQGNVDFVHHLFSHLSSSKLKPDKVTLTIMAQHQDDPEDIWSTYTSMVEDAEVVPDVYAYNVVLGKLCARSAMALPRTTTTSDRIDAIVTKMLEHGVEPDGWTLNHVLMGKFRCGALINVHQVEHIINRLDVPPDSIALATVIREFSRRGRISAMESCFERFAPTHHAQMRTHEVLCAMMEGYLRSGRVNDGRRVFRMMEEENVANTTRCYKALINGAMDHERVDVARDALHAMSREIHRRSSSSDKHVERWESELERMVPRVARACARLGMEEDAETLKALLVVPNDGEVDQQPPLSDDASSSQPID